MEKAVQAFLGASVRVVRSGGGGCCNILYSFFETLVQVNVLRGDGGSDGGHEWRQ